MSDEVVQNPHDRFFRTAFGDPERARSLLRGILPGDVVSSLAWSTLRLEPGSYLDEHLRERISDLLFSVKADQADETDVFVYCLIEHQSTPDRWMPLRQLGYQVRIWEDFRRRHPQATHLPAIVPVVIYQGQSPWSHPLDFATLVAPPPSAQGAFAEWIPDVSFVFVPIQQIELEKMAADLSVRLILTFMREIMVSPDTERVRRCFGVLSELADCADDGQFIRTCLTYLFDRSGNVDTGFFEKQIEGSSFGSFKEDIMTLAQQYIEKGRQEGEETGRLQAVRESILEVLEVRFGSVPEDLSHAVAAVEDMDELHRLLRTAARCPDLNAFHAAL